MTEYSYASNIDSSWCDTTNDPAQEDHEVAAGSTEECTMSRTESADLPVTPADRMIVDAHESIIFGGGDFDLVLGGQGGSVRLTGSFEDDVLPYRPILYRYALSRTKNASDAEDLVQETMFKAFKAYGRLRPESYLNAWLFTILRNSWINQYRMASRRPTETLLDDIADAQIKTANGPLRDYDSAEHQVLHHALDADVAEAFGSLSESMRRTVYLVAVAGLDSQRAAQEMGVSPGTVLSRMHRARRTLRRSLRHRAAAFEPVAQHPESETSTVAEPATNADRRSALSHAPGVCDSRCAAVAIEQRRTA